MIKIHHAFAKNLLARPYLAFANIISKAQNGSAGMISVFLQNLAVILASLLVLGNHRADYTLYIAIAAIILTVFG